jgi:glycosyltransferase involved in cell wall biosynthesis
MTEHDIIFITNLPAFYKIQLYQALAEHARVGVIFLAATSKTRTPDFYQAPSHFSSLFLHEGTVESRPRVKTSYRVWPTFQHLGSHWWGVGGWHAPEYWLALKQAKVLHRAMALESSGMESVTKGVKGALKRWFVSQLDVAFPSGQSHANLLSHLGFQGQMHLTQGVGLFNRSGKRKTLSPFQGRFLYVGRLAPEKNLTFLLRVFAQCPQFSLTLAGTGPLLDTLKYQASPNVSFLGHVPNSILSDVYAAHDVLVLPSLQEPWGLVVEEALYHGLPIVASNRIGCAEEWIVQPKTGFLFDPTQPESLHTALKKIAHPTTFIDIQTRVLQINFEERDERQKRCYWDGVI